MNKTSFMTELTDKTGINAEQATLVNEIFENNFFLKKKNSDNIIAQISESLSVDNGRAREIYDAAYDIIGNGIISKLKHPFGEQK